MKVNCDLCKNEFNKLPNQIKKTKGNYCSRSCSAKSNNVKFPKRKPEGKCLSCNCEIPAGIKRCKNCRAQEKQQLEKEKYEIIFGKYSHQKDLCTCGNVKYKKSLLCIECYSINLTLKTKLDFEHKMMATKPVDTPESVNTPVKSPKTMICIQKAALSADTVSMLKYVILKLLKISMTLI